MRQRYGGECRIDADFGKPTRPTANSRGNGSANNDKYRYTGRMVVSSPEKNMRPYQRETYENFLDWYAPPSPTITVEEREALIAFTVGLGKTFTAATCVRYASDHGPILWLTHREELINQSALELIEELSECTGLSVEIEKAEKRVRPGAKIVVASIPSLSKARLARMQEDMGVPALIVFDEAHHAIAKTWLRVKLAFPETKVLNLTATPYRADVRNRLNLGRVLGQKNTSDGIRMGYLVPFRHAATIQVKLKGLTVRLGDFVTSSLAALLSQEEIATTCAEAILRHGQGKRSIVFGANVAHSQLIAGLLRAGGMRVEEVYGDTPTETRKSYYAALKAGEIDALVNNMILTEGFNLPEIDLVAILRPTKNAALYLQMLGRGLRTCKATSKRECLVIDVVDAPKQKGGTEDLSLPNEDDIKRFAALVGYHYPPATVFLSWFRKATEVAKGLTGIDAAKLNTPNRLFEAIYSRNPQESDGRRMEQIRVLYRKNAELPSEDPDGFKALLAFMHSGNIETALNVLSLSGWKYYPRLDFTQPASTGEVSGGGGLAIRLEALIEDDPQLKNFIADIFENHNLVEETARKYYEIMCIGTTDTVWLRPLEKLQTEAFCYIPAQDRIFFRQPGDERMFTFEKHTRMVRDATVQQVLAETPDYLTGDGWAKLPMSERQTPIVAEILGLSDADMAKAKISRLVASCLITGKTYKKSLNRIHKWTETFLTQSA